MILRILFSIITLALAGYGLITRNFEFQAYLILFLGLSMLVTGIQEFQQNKKLTGWLLIVVFAFSLFVSIQSFILH
ncbi:YczI family protein [Paenisporosarcina sp. FSL H8-0542]|uniref:YczI family protein n=1 Tax=Paenisporosarcina sp. FSL H8-0542 TaxID=2921401 RepID=UPI003159CCA2